MISWILNSLNTIRWFPYYFITPLPYAIGNASEQILLAGNNAIRENKILIVLSTRFLARSLKYSICNKHLFNDLLLKKFSSKNNYFIKFIINFFLEIEFFFKRIFILLNDSYLKIKLKENNRFLSIGIPEIYESENVTSKNLLQKKFNEIPKFSINYNIFDLKKTTKKKCEIILKKNIVNIKKPIVCIHVRDNKFRTDKGRKEYRNSDINNYIEAIKYLIKKNYQVIRIGRSVSKKINFKSKFFLDYSASSIQSDEMDLFLIQKCKFYIGTQSGILDVAYMFNKPILTTNMVELFNSFPRKKTDRGVFKKIFRKNGEPVALKRYIGFSHKKYHIPENEVKDLRFKENSPSELLDSVIEFEENLKKKTTTNLQKNFLQYLKISYKTSINNSIKTREIFPYEDAIKQIRMFKSSQGNLCQSYLKKNFN